MQNEKAKPAKAQTETGAKAKAKSAPARKPKPAVKTAAAQAPKISPAVQHLNAGVNSDHVNASRKTAIGIGVTKYKKTIPQLRDRPTDLFASLRKAYADKPFPARSLDNALIARLVNSGLLLHDAQTGYAYSDEKTGAAYIGDAPGNPAMLRINPKHANYGKA